jgi:hypothetical protein
VIALSIIVGMSWSNVLMNIGETRVDIVAGTTLFPGSPLMIEVGRSHLGQFAAISRSLKTENLS